MAIDGEACGSKARFLNTAGGSSETDNVFARVMLVNGTRRIGAFLFARFSVSLLSRAQVYTP